MNRKYYKKIRKNKYRIITALPIIVIICTLISMNFLKFLEYKDELEETKQIQEQIELKSKENFELESILKIDDGEFYKMIAREKYGYASPDERVYYDIG
jgi:cell division protein FtsB